MFWRQCDLLVFKGAQLVQALLTGLKTSQFFRPFCPQGSDPPTTYNLLFREQTPEESQTSSDKSEVNIFSLLDGQILNPKFRLKLIFTYIYIMANNQ